MGVVRVIADAGDAPAIVGCVVTARFRFRLGGLEVVRPAPMLTLTSARSVCVSDLGRAAATLGAGRATPGMGTGVALALALVVMAAESGDWSSGPVEIALVVIDGARLSPACGNGCGVDSFELPDADADALAVGVGVELEAKASIANAKSGEERAVFLFV